MPSSDPGRLAIALAVVALCCTSCVARQRREMVEAREAYQECVRQNPETHERKCAALEAEALTRQQRYEDDARQAWGCGGTAGPACNPRDREPRVP
jgi:hypothetical protein